MAGVSHSRKLHLDQSPGDATAASPALRGSKVTRLASPSVSIHAHFYQPPREDPFLGDVPHERGAEPYHDFNEKINAECYAPNAALGSFSRISFDLGPTLASWLERHDRKTYRRILDQERVHYEQFGCSNALAQVYSHAIMPLASPREKRIQVSWGLADFRHRFGHRAPGIWLAETAADSATLAVLADYGVGFTVLSPSQAAEPVDPSEPYWVRLPDGRPMTVFFYQGDLSGGVSFDPGLTSNADHFGINVLSHYRDRHQPIRSAADLLLIATDGELYGHHQPLRQHFLSYLLRIVAPSAGFEVTTLARYLQANPPRREIKLLEPSSWSCFHGVDRWKSDCPCTEGDGQWKGHLRNALNALAARLDEIYFGEMSTVLADPSQAEEQYIQVKLGALTPTAFWRRHARQQQSTEGRDLAMSLLEGQYYRHLMYASCAFFFEDLDRIEPRNAILYGLRALRAAPTHYQSELESIFSSSLSHARSWRTGRNGAEILGELHQQHLPHPALVGVA
jgi:alpha-amylase/alpha-mannosidase (GH57 family)